MRVYLPADAGDLHDLLANRALSARRSYAATASLRTWFGAGDDEEFEHAASWRAAERAGGFVLPADVDDEAVIDCGGTDDPGAVELSSPVRRRDVAAVLAVQVDDLAWYGVQEADLLIEHGGS